MDYFNKKAELTKEDYELCGMKAPEVPYDEEIVAYARKIYYNFCSAPCWSPGLGAPAGANKRRDMFFIDNLKEINGVEVRCYFKAGIPNWLNLYNSFGPFYFVIQEVSTGKIVFEKCFPVKQRDTKEEYEKAFFRKIIALFIELRRALPHCSIKDGELCVDFPKPDWFAAPGATAQPPVNNIYIDLQKQEPPEPQFGVATRLFPFIPKNSERTNKVFYKLDSFPNSRPRPRLDEGAIVEGNYRGRGRWYIGKITRKHENGTYDIKYDDGDCEEGVDEKMIRVLGGVVDLSMNYKEYNYYADKESNGTLCFSSYKTHFNDVVPANDTKISKETAAKVAHAAETYFRIKKEDEFVAANDVSVTNTLDGGTLTYTDYSSGSNVVPVNDIVGGEFADATKTATYSDISGATTLSDFLQKVDCSACSINCYGDIVVDISNVVEEMASNTDVFYNRQFWAIHGIIELTIDYLKNHATNNGVYDIVKCFDVDLSVLDNLILRGDGFDTDVAKQKASIKNKFERIIECLKKYDLAKFSPSVNIDVEDALTKICDELSELPELWKFYYNVPDKSLFNFLDRSILGIKLPVFKPAAAAQRPPSLIETEIKAFHELIGYKKECPGIIDQKSLDYCTLSWEELDIIKQLNKQKQGEPPAYGLNGLNGVSGNVLIQTDVTSFLTSEPSPQCDSVVATTEKEIPST